MGSLRKVADASLDRDGFVLDARTGLGRLFVVLVWAIFVLPIGCASTSKMAKPLSEFSAATSDATAATTSALAIVQSVDQESQAIETAKDPPP